MFEKISLEVFLDRNRITVNQWERSACDWSELKAIALDYEKNIGLLKEQAQFFANVIQKFDPVHSVRWRVKDTEHLLEKIVRKCADDVQKYKSISRTNYFEIITDLIGIRALHLFKDDCFKIDEALQEQWTPIETPIAYIRAGDQDKLTQRFSEHGFETKAHPAGYRSIHYVFSSQPTQRRVVIEVQVRTIFEEGWSEIDHKVRYPNLSDAPLVDYFLTIFNRMAGSADEMGGFVLGLASTLQESKGQIDEANRNTEKALQDMEQTVEELAQMKKQDGSSKTVIAKLQAELARLIQSRDIESRAVNSHRSVATEISSENIKKKIFSDNFGLYQSTNIEDMKRSLGFEISEELKRSLSSKISDELKHALSQKIPEQLKRSLPMSIADLAALEMSKNSILGKLKDE